MSEFNPLHSRLLGTRPLRLHIQSAWTRHLPFAFSLVELQQPRTVVELGAHWGISYCAFCQAVQELGLETRCFAVDTWAGDADAGFYGQEVFEDLQRHHRRYESFSKLLRMTFEEARGQIADGSVDLLHIDGLHSDEAVKQDYETWRPKMSDRGVILFHDTMVTDRGFGVHKLWAEISREFPHFNFAHGYGLGVLGVGKNLPPPVADFLRTAAERPEATRQLFAMLGETWQTETEKAEAQAERARRSWLRRAVDRLTKA